MPSPVEAVMDFLAAEQARGVSHVYLDEGARDGLRALFRRAKAAAVSKKARPPEDSARPAPSPPVQVSLHVEGESKAERLASLRQQAVGWAPARALGTLRDIMVFATGSPEARLMFVGEAPGHEEEKKGEPFVGTAGQKLDLILNAMGLAREDVYISNILKFRPATERQATNNRPPTQEEMDVCLPFIRAEIEIVRPACIVALGLSAAKSLLGLTGQVADMRGSWHRYADIPVRVTYHPSYLLRSDANLAIKRQVWDDMLMVMEELIMPISPRQRAFFMPKP